MRKAVVLMYHRIASPEIDPWQLSVTRENFEEHLTILQATGKVISVSELVKNIQQKELRKDAICITFDDGYQDNFLYALPLLEKYDCPASFFIASGQINSNEPYWWDILGDIFLLVEQLPAELDICIADKRFQYKLNNNGVLTAEEKSAHATWYWPVDPPTQRCEMYLNIWMQLRNLPYMLISETVNELKNWSQVQVKNDTGNFPMTRQELYDLSSHPLVETGVHTVTHAALGAMAKDIQVSEISGCKDFLDRNLNYRHDVIAFPYGFYNNDTKDAVKQAGLKAAFTTDARPVTVKSDIMQMGRYQVINQSGDEFRTKLNKLLAN